MKTFFFGCGEGGGEGEYSLYNVGQCAMALNSSKVIGSISVKSVRLLCSFSHFQDLLFLILAINLSLIQMIMFFWLIELFNV